jgi:hypothetical protein
MVDQPSEGEERVVRLDDDIRFRGVGKHRIGLNEFLWEAIVQSFEYK